MEQHVFAFSLLIEGATGKVLQFIMSFKSIFNKNLSCVEQKMYFGTIQRGSKNKKSINSNYFCNKFFSDDLFKAAPYRLMLVSNKDALLII